MANITVTENERAEEGKAYEFNKEDTEKKRRWIKEIIELKVEVLY